jgi:hypothetical protein
MERVLGAGKLHAEHGEIRRNGGVLDLYAVSGKLVEAALMHGAARRIGNRAVFRSGPPAATVWVAAKS